MASERVLLDTDGDGIATITLNRPERLNATAPGMLDEIFDTIEHVAQSDARVLVITGAGRGFCSGQDLKERAPANTRLLKKRFTPRTGQDSFVRALRHAPQPVIAAVNGPAVGVGFSLALACDLRIASTEAKFGAAWLKRGIPPEALGAYTLPQIVSLPKAMEIIFMGKMLDSKEAAEIGLVNEVVPHDKLYERTHEVALTLAKGPPIALAMAKRAVYLGLRQDLETFAQYESFTLRNAFQSSDREEGVRSFLEKRDPEFAGE